MNKPNARFQALAGHLVDYWRLARFQFTTPHSVTKFRQIVAAARQTGADTLIETGTFRGVTAARCAVKFKKVYTIELDPTLAREAAEYLRAWPNIEPIEGDAVKELPKILARSDVRDAIVFLDGHFSGGVTASGEQPEPAVEEIHILREHRDKIAGIIVDDFRCFGVDPGWPSKSALLRAIEQDFPDYRLSVHLDQVVVLRPGSRLAGEPMTRLAPPSNA